MATTASTSLVTDLLPTKMEAKSRISTTCQRKSKIGKLSRRTMMIRRGLMMMMMIVMKNNCDSPISIMVFIHPATCMIKLFKVISFM